MATDDQILVSCTNGECSVRLRMPLLDLATFILIHPGRMIPSYAEAEATKPVVPCPACDVEGREGTLVYVDDHLRKSPPDKESVVPALRDAGLRGAGTVWRKVLQIGTVFEDALPGKLGGGVPLGVALEVRPYGGYVLRHGNNDRDRQYDVEPAGATSPKGGYVRELKRDLLYMAYYGDREHDAAKEMGGAGTFEAMTVGAILALKFDFWFFYGVPITADPAAAAISDEQFRSITLESFSGPMLLDMAAIGDNPVEPIYRKVIRPIAEALKGLGVVHQRLAQALELYDQSCAAGLSEKQRSSLRHDAKEEFEAAAKRMARKGPGVIALPSTAGVAGVRKRRRITDVLAHPCFEQTKRKPWPVFAAQLRSVAALGELRDGSHRASIETLIATEGGVGALANAADAALDRYDAYITAAASLDAAAVEDVLGLIGGLPETFEPYLAALRAQAVVDHGTALYIKAVMAGIKIGSASGKVPHPGRKLVYRTALGGIMGEPDDLDGFADMVIEACKESGQFTMPPFIMLERQKNESGFRATSRVLDLALTKEERRARVPQLGIDWSNWGRTETAETKFYFSELFTHSVARRQKEDPGYFGPIVHSRGAGAGQVTLPTLMKGVSPKGRDSKSYGFSWVSGIPVSADNETVAVPPHWNGAQGSIRTARDLLKKKFRDIDGARDCTFDRVAGGVKYDCSRCLARFDLGAERDLRSLGVNGSIRSFWCAVDGSRWPELFGEELKKDDKSGRAELPCSWLRAVQLYAGSGIKSYTRILKTSREIVSLADPTVVDESDKRQALRAAIDRARRQL